MIRHLLISISFMLVATLSGMAVDDSSVSAEDIKALVNQQHSVSSVMPWRDGVVFNLDYRS